MRNGAYPKLERILSAYFNQDWSLDFVDDDAVLNEIVRVFEQIDLREATSEIHDLLASDANLSNTLLFSVGCYFNPESIGLTYRQWLDKVANRFAASQTGS